MPTWVLAMTLMLGSLMVFMAGVVLDSVARSRAEQKRIHYLSIAPSRGEQHAAMTIAALILFRSAAKRPRPLEAAHEPRDHE